MARNSTSDDIAASVRRLSAGLERWRALFAHQHGLGVNDSVLLSHLAVADGRLLPRDLARLMSVRTGTLTAMLDRLEGAGFVRRVPNPADRRSTFVELTEQGWTSLEGPLRILRERISAALPERARAPFARHLAELARLIEEIDNELEGESTD